MLFKKLRWIFVPFVLQTEPSAAVSDWLVLKINPHLFILETLMFKSPRPQSRDRNQCR